LESFTLEKRFRERFGDFTSQKIGNFQGYGIYQSAGGFLAISQEVLAEQNAPLFINKKSSTEESVLRKIFRILNPNDYSPVIRWEQELDILKEKLLDSSSLPNNSLAAKKLAMTIQTFGELESLYLPKYFRKAKYSQRTFGHQSLLRKLIPGFVKDELRNFVKANMG
jgi:hypothetical protein